MTERYCEGERFADLSFTEETFEDCGFTDCVSVDCSFTKCELDHTTLNECKFVRCQCSGALWLSFGYGMQSQDIRPSNVPTNTG